MRREEFYKLINKEKYQVFILTSPAPFPFSFARHPWFVLSKKGQLSRWEVIHRNINHSARWGQLYMDLFSPLQGIEVVLFLKKYFWKSKLLGQIEGEVAEKIAKFIESSPTSYSHSYNYHFFGPNSNTYAQWVLNNFPEVKIKLPWNCFGKNYKKQAIR